jgi:hypothetical protein
VVDPRAAGHAVAGLLVLVVADVHAQVGARRLDERDVRDPVVARDLERAHPFLARVGRERAAEHGRIVGEDHALGARDHADPRDRAAADRIRRVVGGERTDLEERAVGVECERDPLAHGQLAALREPRVVRGAAARLGLVEQPVDLGELLDHRGAVLGEFGCARVERGAQRGREQGRVLH